MLKNTPKLLSPELLKALSEMGHGDELVIADANFPAHSMNAHVIRADGISGTDMLKAILTVIPLDTYASENFMLMETTNGDPTPTIWAEYEKIASSLDKNVKKKMIERFAFYERSKKAYLVIETGEERIYGNIILKKGVIK
ncbi:MAG: L-fucose mutarotase [Bacilli bacterium]|nr:L-fucose mutarotase [Bacilli bacterium]